MSSLRDELDEARRTRFKPKKEQKIWEWIEENCELPPESGAKLKGPIDTNVTPYSRGIYDAYADNAVRFITIAKSAQVGGTTILKNLVLWDIANHPCPGQYITATDKLVTSFNDRELEPHFRHCNEVEKLADRRRDRWSKREKIFTNGATLRLRGSNSPNNLASFSAERIKLDEVDKWPGESNREGPAVDLAIDRTKAYEEVRKVCIISTPTIEYGALWQYYLRGSQEKFHVPCVHCGFKQELQFRWGKGQGSLWWPEECLRSDGTYDLDLVAHETRYQCVHCGGLIHNNQKKSMNSKGEWVKTNPNAPSDHRSFHISALYSPFETWGGIAKSFLQSKGASGRMHNFLNSYLGLPWMRQATVVKRSVIKEIVEISPDYRRGELPVKPLIIAMTVDVQQENFWWIIRAWENTGVSYLIDYGAAISYEDLKEIISKEYEFDGQKYRVYKAMIDSGYTARRRSGVYDWCLATGGKFFPSKGATKSQGLRSSVRHSVVDHRQSRLILETYDDDMYKEELYRSRIKERAGRAWYLPVDITNEYIEQLTAERLVERTSPRGGIEFVWESSRDNHLGDCEKMQLVFWDLVAPHVRLEEPEDEQDRDVEPLLKVDTPLPEWS